MNMNVQSCRVFLGLSRRRMDFVANPAVAPLHVDYLTSGLIRHSTTSPSFPQALNTQRVSGQFLELRQCHVLLLEPLQELIAAILKSQVPSLLCPIGISHILVNIDSPQTTIYHVGHACPCTH